MADDSTATTAPAAPSNAPESEPGYAPGAPDASAGHAPAPAPAAQPEHAPATGTSGLFKDVAEAESRYKALQAQFTHLTQGLSKYHVRSAGELEDRLQLLSELSSNPEFLSWAQQQLNRATAGTDDPETQKAVELVRQLADEVAESKLAPFKAEQALSKAHGTLDQLGQRYGAELVGVMKPRMFELLQTYKSRGLVSDAVEQNFDYDFVEGLFLTVAGRDPAFAAKQHQKRLEQKRAATTTSESGPPASMVAATPAKDMQEAWQTAKRQLGMA